MGNPDSKAIESLEKRLAKMERQLLRLREASERKSRKWQFWRKRKKVKQPEEASPSPPIETADSNSPDFATDEELFREAVRLLVRKRASAVDLLERNRAFVSDQCQLETVLAALLLTPKTMEEAREALHRAVALAEPKNQKLIWGPIAIISNKYWSAAMREAGWDSETIVYSHASINQREDFDHYIGDFIPDWWPEEVEKESFYAFLQVYAFMHWIQFAKVVHMPVTGGFLGSTPLWEEEAPLYRKAGIKTVVIPFGGDAYTYSRLFDPTLRYALLANYPQLAIQEREIQKKLTYWQEQADCFLCGCMIDAMGRWDVTLCSAVHLDVDQWKPKAVYSENDGRNGAVKIMHTPNHRGFKGTEFLLNAVENLKKKGLKIELVLLEKIPNYRVRELMQEVDILGEQFVATAYALSGIEGMASGLPVMANLDSEYYTRVYRRYAYLNECPILSTTPETLQRNLEMLITHPDLRRKLGIAGRQYVEKYHSFDAARYLFGKIYQKIVDAEEIDLFTLYHPITSEHSRSFPLIDHPLVESRLPKTLLQKKN